MQEDKDAFRSNLEEIIRHVEPETVLVVAGDMNAHVGKRQNSEKTIGKYGWGTRNREGQDLVVMLARNQLVVVNSFQKRESPKITYRMWIGRSKQRRRMQRQVIRWWKCEGESDGKIQKQSR